MADFVSILIAFAAGVAVRQFYKQIWAGIKAGASLVSKKFVGTPAQPAPKAPPKS